MDDIFLKFDIGKKKECKRLRKVVLSAFFFVLIVFSYPQSALALEAELPAAERFRESEYVPKEQDFLSPDTDSESLTADEAVRVIIELEDNALIDEAILRNIDYDELDEQFIEEKRQEIKKEQSRLIGEIRDESIPIDTSEGLSYDTLLNAVSASVSEKDIEKIEQNEKVKSVYISEEFQRPLLRSSHLTGAYSYAWNTMHYKGEGTVIAVIDTGVDYRHTAMRLDSPDSVKLKQSDVGEIIAERRLKGHFYTEKVPYGYNYYDHNGNLYDSYGSMHGMHVAGILAANDPNNKLYGVAPNAQILAMKVFSDDLQYPTTFTDIWLKALDDSIALKADVINMSLGSAAGFSVDRKHYPESEWMNKAKEAGILVVVAAGNEASITEGNPTGSAPLPGNYDTATIANPALHDNTLAVASMENKTKETTALSWMASDGTKRFDEINLHTGKNPPANINGNTVDLGDGIRLPSPALIRKQIVLVELPLPEKMKGFTQVLEKIAVIKPKAILVYNSEVEGERLGTRISVSGILENIPIGKIKRSTYQSIKEEMNRNPLGFPVTVETRPVTITNPLSGRLSTFSSWGPTPDLRMKPEITAVGGNVYSTVEDDRYQSKSGTSMASPQVAGASAILYQHLRNQGIPSENISDLTKVLLMNTAIPILDHRSANTPCFVRQQGSGALHLEHALKTKVAVRATGTNDTLPDGKLELRQLSEKQFSATLSFTNLSEETICYRMHPEAVFEPISNGHRTMRPKLLQSAVQNNYEEIIVPAADTVEYSFFFDYSDAEELTEDNFLEGFLYLDNSEGEVDLSIPFLGFYGDWTKQDAIDAFAVPEIGKEEKPVQFMVNRELGVRASSFVSDSRLALPVIDNTVYFAPGSEYFKNIALRLAPLRNMEEIEYSLIDPVSGETLRVIGISGSVRKLNRLWVKNPFQYMPNSLWDGSVNGSQIEEGKEYYYQIKTQLNNEGIGGSGEQIYRYPVKIDTISPKLEEMHPLKVIPMDGRWKEVSFSVVDSGTGIKDVYLESMRFVDGKPKYGKYTRITFVDIPTKDGKELPKVEEGVLRIPRELLPTEPTGNAEIFVFRNGFRRENIQIISPFLADTSYLYVAASDYLSHSSSKTVKTGESMEYKSLHFLNYYNSIKDKGAKIFINDSELTSHLYESIDEKVDVKILLPDQSSHLSTLSLKKSGSTRQIISGDAVDTALAAQYNLQIDPDTNTVSFTIANFNSNIEIITGFAPGPLPDPPKPTGLDLRDIGLMYYKEFKINRQKIDPAPSGGVVDVLSGKITLECKKDPGNVREIEKVLLHQGGVTKVLQKRAYFDVVEGKEGYYSSNYSLYISFNLKEYTRVEVVYKEVGESGHSGTFATPSDATPSDAPRSTPSDAYKYPVIYIKSPSLLSILSEQNVSDGQLQVDGYIANVRADDEIEALHIHLVDKFGDRIGEEIVLPGSELISRNILHKEGETTIYIGKGYDFSVTLPIQDLNTDIRVFLTTTKGYRAGIVRRVFYDRFRPELSHFVMERSLDSSFAEILLTAKDNALKLKLYHNDSLILQKDLTPRSFMEGGITVDKLLRLPLRPGQNEIRISAVDFANYTVEKSIFIYRTE